MQKMKIYPYTQLNSSNITSRRKLVFRYFSQGLSGSGMLDAVNQRYSCSLSTINRDIRCMSQWLPAMLNLQEGAEDKAFERLIGNFMMSQERLLQLSYIGDNSNAQVGAARALAMVTQQEAELRMNAGQMVRVPFQMVGVHHLEPDLDGLDEAAVGAIVQNFMDSEARRLRQLDQNVEGSDERSL